LHSPGLLLGPRATAARPIQDLLSRYLAASGKLLVCPVCFNSKQLDTASLIDGAEMGGTVPMWEWIGDEGATTFSY
jgi:hypothetical protein